MSEGASPAAHPVGFVGLGRMGAPMAASLVRAGYEVVGFDASAEATARAKAVAGAGLAPARSLRELAARCPLVVTMLPDGAAVGEVALSAREGADRLVDGMAQGAMLVEMSSSAPADTLALARALAPRGIGVIDAPVSGGVARAETGELTIMAGGEPALIARALPVLEAMSSRIFRTGRLGSGHAMKALNNYVSAAGFLAALEALLVGQGFGLDPGLMVEILNASTGRNNSTEKKLAQQVLARRFASGFALSHMAKDLTAAVSLARDTATPAPFAALCRELCAAATVKLGPEADHTALACWLEEMAGRVLSGGAADRPPP